MKGRFAAADEWDEPMQILRVNPPREDSYERLMHDTGILSFLLAADKGSSGGTDKAKAGEIYRCDMSSSYRALQPLHEGRLAPAMRRLHMV